jgi:hypothetical protein
MQKISQASRKWKQAGVVILIWNSKLQHKIRRDKEGYYKLAKELSIKKL